jgi:hypothetical protein
MVEMSSLVFPLSLPGATIESVDQVDEDARQTTLGGKEWRSSWWLAPKYRYRIRFDFLRSTAALVELQTIAGFYTRHRGTLDSFLLSDPEDNAVTGEAFGVGNGSTTAFQLQRSQVPDASLPAAASRSYWPAMGDGYEPVYEMASTPAIYKAGSLQTGGGVNYTLGANGLVTFNSAPANGAVLTWDGTYYRRCRFDDSIQSTRIVQQLWKMGGVSLISVVP